MTDKDKLLTPDEFASLLSELHSHTIVANCTDDEYLPDEVEEAGYEMLDIYKKVRTSYEQTHAKYTALVEAVGKLVVNRLDDYAELHKQLFGFEPTASCSCDCCIKLAQAIGESEGK